MRFHEQLTQTIREFRRRKVFRVGSVYLVVAWGASLGAADLLPAFGVPDWGVRAFVIAAISGLPIALILAWTLEFSAEGIRADRPGRQAGGTEQRHSATTLLATNAPTVRAHWQAHEAGAAKVFANGFVIGRDRECDIQVDDARVSRMHARVFVDKGAWHIEDLGSRNGTRLDGELITRSKLPARSKVRLYPLGPFLELELGDPASGETTKALPE